MVAFDIPEKYRRLRNRVRTILQQSGFVFFQQSIWIFPYECEALVHLLKEESSLSRYILYGVLEKVEGDGKLRKHFGLE